jgi:hypothetical protein
MEPILEWIVANHELASLSVSLGTLLVWVTYLQVFLASYRRQRTGTILITLGQGRGLDGHCLVTNMGAEPVYILALIAHVEGPGGVRSCAITELEGEQWSEPSDLRLWTRQGPLDSGELRDMGTLQGMVEHVLDAGPGKDADNDGPGRTAGLRSVVLQVIAVHGSEDLPMGAERAFDIVADGGAVQMLRPRTHGARQIRSRRERRRLLRLLEEDAGPPMPR